MSLTSVLLRAWISTSNQDLALSILQQLVLLLLLALLLLADGRTCLVLCCARPRGCQQADAVAAAAAIDAALESGGRAYCVCADANHRLGMDYFPGACKDVGLELQQVLSFRDTSYRGLSDFFSDSRALDQSAGYVAGMDLSLFILQTNKQTSTSKQNLAIATKHGFDNPACD